MIPSRDQLVAHLAAVYKPAGATVRASNAELERVCAYWDLDRDANGNLLFPSIPSDGPDRVAALRTIKERIYETLAVAGQQFAAYIEDDTNKQKALLPTFTDPTTHTTTDGLLYAYLLQQFDSSSPPYSLMFQIARFFRALSNDPSSDKCKQVLCLFPPLESDLYQCQGGAQSRLADATLKLGSDSVFETHTLVRDQYVPRVTAYAQSNSHVHIPRVLEFLIGVPKDVLSSTDPHFVSGISNMKLSDALRFMWLYDATFAFEFQRSKVQQLRELRHKTSNDDLNNASVVNDLTDTLQKQHGFSPQDCYELLADPDNADRDYTWNDAYLERYLATAFPLAYAPLTADAPAGYLTSFSSPSSIGLQPPYVAEQLVDFLLGDDLNLKQAAIDVLFVNSEHFMGASLITVFDVRHLLGDREVSFAGLPELSRTKLQYAFERLAIGIAPAPTQFPNGHKLHQHWNYLAEGRTFPTDRFRQQRLLSEWCEFNAPIERLLELIYSKELTLTHRDAFCLFFRMVSGEYDARFQPQILSLLPRDFFSLRFDFQGTSGYTPLMLASQYGCTAAINYLIDMPGAKRRDLIAATSDSDDHPLFLAVRYGHADCIPLLACWNNEPVNRTRAPNGSTLLMLATQQGDKACVRELLKAGADPDITTADNGETALMIAAMRGHADCIQLLLNAGASADAIAHQGLTALMHAAYRGHTQCVYALLYKKARPNIAEFNHDITALSYAAERGHVECVKLLLLCGADINVLDRAGETPLISAAFKGQIHCVRALLDAGARTDITDQQGLSASMSAARGGYRECLHLLESHTQSVHINRKDLVGCTALTFATCFEHNECFDLAIQLGADISVVDHGYSTLLMYAAFAGNLYALNRLLDAGLPINATNYASETALMVATYSGNPDCVKRLLAAGARIDMRNIKNQTALEMGIEEMNKAATEHPHLTALEHAEKKKRIAECISILREAEAHMAHEGSDHSSDTRLTKYEGIVIMLSDNVMSQVARKSLSARTVLTAHEKEIRTHLHNTIRAVCVDDDSVERVFGVRINFDFVGVFSLYANPKIRRIIDTVGKRIEEKVAAPDAEYSFSDILTEDDLVNRKAGAEASFHFSIP